MILTGSIALGSSVRFSFGGSGAGASSFFAFGAFFGLAAGGASAVATAVSVAATADTVSSFGVSAGASASGLADLVFLAGFFASDSAMANYLLDLAGLCVLVADHAHCFARTFARARIRGCALAAHWQASPMPDAAIT